MTHCGYFNTPATTGNQTISGVGFRPNLVFFFNGMSSSDGSATDVCMNQGFALEVSSTITQYARTFRSNQTGGANVVGASGDSTTNCLRGNETTTTVDLLASLSSFNDDGFIINYTTVPATSRRIFYAAVYVENLSITTTSRSTSGTMTVTGLGFRPEALIGLHRASDSENIGVGNASTYFSNCQRLQNGTTFTTTAINWSSGGAMFLSGYGGRDDSVSIQSLDADGYTLFKNTSTATGPTIRVIAMADPEKSFGVGSFTPPQTGSTSVTGLGFKPGLLLLFGLHDQDVSASYNFQTGFRVFFGAVDGNGNQWALGNRATTAGSQSRFMDSDSCTSRQTQLTNSHSFAFDDDGFTVQAVSGSASTAKCAFIAFEESASGGALPLLGVG